MGSTSSADRLSAIQSISQLQCRSNVTLVEAALTDASFASSVILGSPVRIDAAQRSGLLSAIGDTEGTANLPDVLSVEDVRLWQTACVVSCQPSTNELVNILQVADVLGDPAAESWVSMLAQQALQLPSPWQSQASGPDTICALVQLPSHLRSRVLSACLATPNTTLTRLLTTFPFAFHSALIACAVAARGGVLEVPTQSQDTFLPLLASTTMHPPGLLNLSFKAESEACSNAAQLASALAHHSTLTDLCLNQSLHPEWVRALGTCMPPGVLPSLKSLVISINASPGSSIPLSFCLCRFTAITRLHIVLNRTRPQATSAQGVSSYVTSATSPAPLTFLQKLIIEEYLSLPNTAASSLMYASSQSSINFLLPLLSAPALTDLQITSDLAAISWQELSHNVRQCSNLQVLELHTDLLGNQSPTTYMRPALMQSSAKRSTSKTDDRLLSIHALSIASRSALSQFTMADCVVHQAADSLIRISLSHKHVLSGGSARRTVPSLTNEQATKAWDDAIAALTQCKRLEYLQLPVPMAAHISADGSEALACAVACMSQLSELSLDGPCQQCWPGAPCTLHGAAFGRALRALPRLQRLHVGGGAACTVSELERLLDALPSCKSLTSLGLCCGGLDQTVVAELISKLRTLKTLHLAAAVFEGDAEEATLDAFAARFPKVKISICSVGQ